MGKAIIYHIRSDFPETHKIAKVARALDEGAVVLYPTDTVYALGCNPRNKNALDRLRRIKGISTKDGATPLTLIGPSLSGIANYAVVTDQAYRLLKTLTPGPFTFIFKATKEVPKLVQNPRRKTVGLRIPDHKICHALVEASSEGLLVSSSARQKEADLPESFGEMMDCFASQADIVIESDEPFNLTPSTVIDLTNDEFELVRGGKGIEALEPYLLV